MTQDHSDKVGRRVVVTKADGDTLEGTLQAASDVGALVKPKGRSRDVLLETHEIASISLPVRGPKRLRQKHLKPVDSEKVRDHLIDRHGYGLEDIQNMSEAGAAEFHDSIDHTELGHDHQRGLSKVENGPDTEHSAESAESADEADDE